MGNREQRFRISARQAVSVLRLWGKNRLAVCGCMKNDEFERMEPDELNMRQALREAETALEIDDVPVGAVIVHQDRIIGRGHNQREQLQDPLPTRR